MKQRFHTASVKFFDVGGNCIAVNIQKPGGERRITGTVSRLPV
nr:MULTISPECIES: hypothetical protein [Bacillus]